MRSAGPEWGNSVSDAGHAMPDAIAYPSAAIQPPSKVTAARRVSLDAEAQYDMPNIASVFKAEISRLARKELREESDGLRKTVAAHRADIAALKRRVQSLESMVARLTKSSSAKRVPAGSSSASPASGENDGSEHRFSAKGMATNRRRLGLSASDFALLVGTTGQSIYAWEAGKSKPKAAAVVAIAALRGIGKREVATKLATLKSQ
jgi:DNA-binding transcriptional regulator YiaG